MISRAAEHCCALGRCIERIEASARLLEVNLAFQDEVPQPPGQRWLPLALAAGGQVPAGLADDAEAVQEHLGWSELHPGSLRGALRAAREHARAVRDALGPDPWELLDGLWHWLQQRPARRLWKGDRRAFYRRLRDAAPLFHGLAQSTMAHEEPFDFIRLGTALERAAQTARALDVQQRRAVPHGGPELPLETAQWLAALRACAGVEPFRRRADAALSGAAVARFLLLDWTFPRSVQHSWVRARGVLELLRRGRSAGVGARSWQQLQLALEPLQRQSAEALREPGLRELLGGVLAHGEALERELRADFFAPGLPEPAAAPLAPAGDVPAALPA